MSGQWYKPASSQLPQLADRHGKLHCRVFKIKGIYVNKLVYRHNFNHAEDDFVIIFVVRNNTCKKKIETMPSSVYFEKVNYENREKVGKGGL